MSDNLSLTQLSASQNNKETTINDTNGELDAALTANFTLPVDNTNTAAVTVAQLQRAATVVVTEGAPAPTGPITITFEALERGTFTIINNTAQTVTAEITGQTKTSPAVAAGDTAILNMDGSNVTQAGGGGGGPSGTFIGQSDTPANYTGSALLGLRVNAGETAVEFYDTAVVELNAQTASYTLVLADKGKLVRMNVASANNLTVPANATVAFPVGTVINVRQAGVGQTTIVASGGVTINTPETLLCRAQHATVSLVKVATDEWDLTGDLEAAP